VVTAYGQVRHMLFLIDKDKKMVYFNVYQADCQSVQPDLAPEGAWVTPKDVGGWSGCSGVYQGVCLSGCTLRTCTQRRCTCTVP
jgi:hypothetical protein